jgi:hypothetical protein
MDWTVQDVIPGREKEIFLFSIALRLALVSIQPPIQWVAVTLPKKVKKLWHDTHHSLSYSRVIPLLMYALMACTEITFTFTFTNYT